MSQGMNGPNGMPNNQFNQFGPMGNPPYQGYNNQGYGYQQFPQYGPGGPPNSRNRLNSLLSNQFFDNGQYQGQYQGYNQGFQGYNQGFQGPPPNQYQNYGPGFNQGFQGPQNQFHGPGMPPSGPQSRPKTSNRRSGFPQMNDISALDMGGRGGMPMPGGPPAGATKQQKHRSTSGIPQLNGVTGNVPGSGLQNGMHLYQANKANSAGNLIHSNGPNQMNQNQNHNQPQNQPQNQYPKQQTNSNHLKPPQSHEEASTHSSKSSDTPQTLQLDDVNIHVPQMEGYQVKPQAERPKEKKKKKGLFK